MKLNKKLESEILDMYETFWRSLMNVDNDVYSVLLDDDYRLIGITEEVVFLKKEEAIHFLKAKAEKMAGKIERRKSKLKIEAINNLFLISEQFDAYVLINNIWTFYSKTRISSWMQQQPHGWKILQQHFSFPDTKAVDVPTIGLEKIAKENIELREAIKRQTIELEEKNRELEIETALERVRARAMAMQKSEELLQVISVVSAQMQQLHFRFDNVSFAIRNQAQDYKFWFSAIGLPDAYHISIPYIDNPMFERVRNLTDCELNIYTDTLTVAENRQWHNHVFEHSDLKNLPEQTKEYILSRGYARTILLLPNIMLIVGNYASIPYSENDNLVFKRFAAVFEQCYTRFLDLQKAEAQTREAQIEAALEKVRSRSLAMRKSDELQEVVHTVFEKLNDLNVKLYTAILFTFIEGSKDIIWWLENKANQKYARIVVPYDVNPYLKDIFEAREKGNAFFSKTYSFEEKNELFHHLFKNTDFKQVPEHQKQFLLESELATMSVALAKNTGINITSYTEKTFSENDNEILKRFARVFEQAYIRFLDLQKAEAQTREAKIEAALEKVRSRSLAMHNSSELREVVATLFDELVKLDLVLARCIIWILNGTDESAQLWMANSENKRAESYHLNRIDHRYYHSIFKGWRQQSDHWVYELKGPEKETIDQILLYETELTRLPKVVKKGILSSTQTYVSGAFNKFGLIEASGPVRHTEDQLEILSRFNKVFEHSYTRFLDLQKAEAQAREAQIELALERVRSRSMAMHKSEELRSVVNTLYGELQSLQVNFHVVGIQLIPDKSKDIHMWLSTEDGLYDNIIHWPYGDLAIFEKIYIARTTGNMLQYTLFEADTRKFFAEYFKLEGVPQARKMATKNVKSIDITGFYQQLTGIFLMRYTKGSYSNYEKAIVRRFSRAIEQTYTRFLDLQKAEAQTREAKIEVALEKIRSRTMGMQNSDELPEVANLLFTEVRALGINAWSCGYNILAEDKKTATCCMSSEGTLQTPFQLRLWGETSFDEMGVFVNSDKSMLVQELGDKAIDEHYAYMKSFPDLKPAFDEIDRLGLSLPRYQINHLCKFTQGFLLFITYEKVPESHDIFKRFTKVFDQTYTRFLDLKKAEAQAREAKIENALEKVRSRSLAMQNPGELIEVAQLLREEMGALGVEELETSSIYIHNEENGTTQCWFTIKNADDPEKSITDQMTINLHDTWVGQRMLDFYRSGAIQASIRMQGEQRIEWIRYCEEKSALFTTSGFYGETIPDRTYHLYKFSNGYIGAASPGEISPESWDLLKRATAVFSFAYTRFNDLQIAEASAQAALRQASLDRIRADISSMRNAEDLDKITPLVFNELTTLGIPFIRCGVFIVHENIKMVEVFLSTPDGRSLAAMKLPFGTNEMTAQSVEAWKKEKIYIQHWNQSDFINWGNSLAAQGHVANLQTYQGHGAAPESLHLHFVPFKQGLLYVGSTDALTEEQIDLVKALAKSFAIAYSRYEDFVKLEQANAEVESAMSELKATQSQLVQQEKLASLGQLTAGIAHEIKNPLNFVNNFSEVSLELIEEALEEIVKIDKNVHAEEVREILASIQSNLTKIHQHGTRANTIVTSMLQHSRGGSGKKEPADLNALVKEYVNLCYHGMRAGNKPINVDIALDLDTELGMVPLIKEDFTRVVINLCNNAFDAMRQRSLPGLKDYKPKLSVQTKYQIGHVLLKVADNGPGIPEEIKDKILQPFFTTKKGTEGIGLGLSITNDIVKAHGGELTIDSQKGEGSVFLIRLPI